MNATTNDSKSAGGETDRGAGAGLPLTHLALGVRLEGKVVGRTDLLLDGELTGKVKVDGAVIVAEAGSVEGEIAARAVRIAGRVKGRVRASARIELASSARVEADLVAPRVVVAEGAQLAGNVQREQAKAPARRSSEEPGKSPS